MKLLLYCDKAKPKLMISCRGEYKLEQDFKIITDKAISFNGKIVGECDFEVEEIRYVEYADEWGYETNTLNEDDLIDKSCLSGKQLFDYLKHCKNGAYAIHVKNLHIFDKPSELSNYYNNKKLMIEILKIWENYGLPDKDDYDECSFKKAPQNMCRAFDEKNDYILISLKSEELCRILNGKQTIIVRKKVLKEMIQNE